MGLTVALSKLIEETKTFDKILYLNREWMVVRNVWTDNWVIRANDYRYCCHLTHTEITQDKTYVEHRIIIDEETKVLYNAPAFYYEKN